MSVLSAQSIRKLCVKNSIYLDNPMLDPFEEEHRDLVYINDNKNDSLRISAGLGSASYSISLAQNLHMGQIGVGEPYNFGLFSTIEKFQMPNNICATVHDKSTWARRGLAVQTTFIDPGWCGFLTLEISYHGTGIIKIPSMVGIAQMVFHKLDEETELPYKGKYQHQGEEPQKAL